MKRYNLTCNSIISDPARSVKQDVTKKILTLATSINPSGVDTPIDYAVSWISTKGGSVDSVNRRRADHVTAAVIYSDGWPFRVTESPILWVFTSSASVMGIRLL